MYKVECYYKCFFTYMIFKVVDASPLKKDMATVYWVNKQENTFEIYFDERDKQIIIDSKLEKLVYNIVDE